LVACAGLLSALTVTGCGSKPQTPAPVVSVTQGVFERVVPSVLAVLNDDDDLREEETKRAMKDMGVEGHAPKTVIDVSLRRDAQPHGTGFLVEGGLVLTAAHVIQTPDRLRLTTRAGKTVAAELVRIDEVRDVAVLKPKGELVGVKPLSLDDGQPKVGAPVWALGHTGGGLWALSWGITEGVTSGVVDLLGAKLVLHDAAVYPGFSGGPVITLSTTGEPRVVGVNHAILFTAGVTSYATISSASSVSDIREVLAGKPSPLQSKLAAYAKGRAVEPRIELFVTNNIAVHKDPRMLTTAAIYGNQRVVEQADEARVPIVGMVFGVEPGKQEFEFRVVDPADHTVTTLKRSMALPDRERVGFITADLRFPAKVEGRYEVLVYRKGQKIGHTDVWVQDPNDDDSPINDDDMDDVEDGEPQVNVVVAQAGQSDPLTLLGIRAGWAEWRYPRRVAFTWFARGSRGWSGKNVAISSFVLDDKGTIVGRGVGCIRPEVRPEHPFNCMGQGGTPLLPRAGRYDIVFAINDRPVATWPMEAILRTDGGQGALEKWLDDAKKRGHRAHTHGDEAPKGPAVAPAPGATPKEPAPGVAPPKEPAPGTTPKEPATPPKGTKHGKHPKKH
jgi:S1-C subfamily serine protease